MIIKKLLYLSAVFSFIGVSPISQAEDLWKPHNPYSSHSRLRAGSVIKVKISEPVDLEFEYEDTGSSDTEVKTNPVIWPADLPVTDIEKNIAGSRKKHLKVKTRMNFTMAVQISGITPEGNAELSGTRQVFYEAGNVRFEVRFAGTADLNDITRDNRIKSEDIAGLVLQVTGKPVTPGKGITLKTDAEGKVSADLSEEEKQQLLLEYLNRVLGEASDE